MLVLVVLLKVATLPDCNPPKVAMLPDCDLPKVAMLPDCDHPKVAMLPDCDHPKVATLPDCFHVKLAILLCCSFTKHIRLILIHVRDSQDSVSYDIIGKQTRIHSYIIISVVMQCYRLQS